MTRFFNSAVIGFSSLALATVVGSSAQAAEFVSNGGFELNGGNGQLGTVSSLTDWTANADSFAFAITPSTADSVGANFTSPLSGTLYLWGPNLGSNNGLTNSSNGDTAFAVSSGFGASPLSQTISGLTPGNQYTLSFEQAFGQDSTNTGATQGSWQVTFGSDMFTGTSYNVSSQGFSGWSSETFTFTAASATQTLTFTPIGSGTGLIALLDGVSLTSNSAPPTTTPEPSALLALGALASLAVSNRLKSKSGNKG